MSETTYTRTYRDFRGVDFSSKRSECDPHRFNYLVNMWRDYHSEQGVGVETSPGFRRLMEGDGDKVNSLCYLPGKGGDQASIILHSGNRVYSATIAKSDAGKVELGQKVSLYESAKDTTSRSLLYRDALYMVDGKEYVKIGRSKWPDKIPVDTQATVLEATLDNYGKIYYVEENGYAYIVIKDEEQDTYYYADENRFAPKEIGTLLVAWKRNDLPPVEVVKATDAAYAPITYLNGKPYEQKNVLTDLYIEKFQEPSYKSDGDRILHYVLSEMSDRLRQESTGKGVFIKTTRGEEIRLYPFKVQAPPLTYCEHIPPDDDEHKCSCPSFDYGVNFLTPYIDGFGNLVDKDGNTYLVDKDGNTCLVDNIYPQRINTPVDWDGKAGADEGFIEIRTMTDTVGSTTKRYFFLWIGLYSGTPVGYFLGFVGEETPSTENAEFYSFKFDEKDCGYCDMVDSITEIFFDYGPIPYIGTVDDIAEVVIHGTSKPNSFNKAGDMRDVLSGNLDFIGNTSSTADAINGCTLITEFDGRIFLSGNPNLPNSVFYTQRDLTGYNNPFYIGCYNYLNDGTGRTPITAMITTPTQLIVLKDDVEQGASIYYHYAQDNPAESELTRDLQPRIYPRENGVPGIGCVGMACNFRDDPVLLSPYGLEAIGKAQVNLERTLTHRSSMVDAKLINETLRGAVCAEWDGYLCILVPGGKMYLADSRQVFTHKTGDQQYEWYYWEGIGVWKEQDDRYYYVSQFPGAPDKLGGLPVAWKDEITPAEGENFTAADENVTYTYVKGVVNGVEYAYIVDCYGEKIGGTFKQATALLAVDGLLYFGCEDGTICVFNTDMRGEDQRILPEAFTQNGRRYLSGCATLSDNCGRANLVKSTVRGSLAVVTKSYPYALVEVRVRTNAVSWHECDKIWAGEVDFDHTDFGAFAFLNDGDNDCIAIVREREKRWGEKQLYFLTECYESPFGIISATFDYKIAGRYRNG